MAEKVMEIVRSRAEAIRKAINEGRTVIVGRTVVRSIDVIESPRGSSLIIINDGERVMYPQEFIRARIIIT